ncbi:MAG: hypothetical protein RMM53_12070 [Bacteroidia bacterium]|nr:hypothetical protein [Bacteroidia bacterium]
MARKEEREKEVSKILKSPSYGAIESIAKSLSTSLFSEDLILEYVPMLAGFAGGASAMSRAFRLIPYLNKVPRISRFTAKIPAPFFKGRALRIAPFEGKRRSDLSPALPWRMSKARWKSRVS